MTNLANNLELRSECGLPRYRRSCILSVVLKWSGERGSLKGTKQVSKQKKKPPTSTKQRLPGWWDGCWFSFFRLYCVTVQDFCIACSVALLWQLPGGDRGRVSIPPPSCLSHVTSLRPHVPKRPLEDKLYLYFWKWKSLRKLFRWKVFF